MISIIICSKTPEISVELQKNIEDTIGSDYELVTIDNSQNVYSIFSAYNEGVSRSKGDILCFMHNDILFCSKGWGMKVKKVFQDHTIGLLGVSGTHFLPSVPLYWTESPFITTTNQDNVDGTLYTEHHKEYFGGSNTVDAVACDGQWLCIRKSLFCSICFDENTFQGFHMYDMDICMQILKTGYRVCIVDGILIEHKSRGNFNDAFLKNLEKFTNKWASVLPICRGIEGVSKYTIEKINSTYIANNTLYKKVRKLYSSWNYKLGYHLLYPFRVIISLFQKWKS